MARAEAPNNEGRGHAGEAANDNTDAERKSKSTSSIVLAASRVRLKCKTNELDCKNAQFFGHSSCTDMEITFPAYDIASRTSV